MKLSKSIASVLVLTPLFTGLLTLMLNSQMIKESETIHLGCVYPLTTLITRDGDVYTFTGNIYGSIVLSKSDIVVDGAGYTLQGTGSGKGIDVTAVSRYMNVPIKNLEIKGFAVGIELTSFNEGVISGNTITNNSNYGIALTTWMPLHSPARENIICGNTIADNNKGIYLSESSNNRFYHNNFVNNDEQACVENAANFWDGGILSGGNYWSDHVCTGNPSDGSQPYVLDENNTDHHPFQDPNGWLIPADLDDDGIVDIRNAVMAGKTPSCPRHSR